MVTTPQTQEFRPTTIENYPSDTPSGLTLSNDARNDLRVVLKREVGPERASSFSSEELDKIGLLLLTILAENLKMNC